MAKKDQEKFVKEEVSEEISESSDNKEVKAPEPKPEPLAPYVHIDTFLQTAVPLFKLNRMQTVGFKARMNGRHYQRDEQVFVDELKKYLNLK
jgi:hypothetical protein